MTVGWECLIVETGAVRLLLGCCNESVRSKQVAAVAYNISDMQSPTAFVERESLDELTLIND